MGARVSFIASVVTIFIFATGIVSFGELLEYVGEAKPPKTSPAFDEIIFTAKTLEGEMLPVATEFSGNVEEVFATFEYSDMTPNIRFHRTWYGPSNKVVAEYLEEWDDTQWGANGTRVLPPFFNRSSWPAGEYRLQLRIDGEIAQIGTFTIRK